MCEPGSIFITAKVYDDIKHHAWISATSLGYYKIEDLPEEYELYAISNKGLYVPLAGKSPKSRKMPSKIEPREYQVSPAAGKKKGTVGVLALLMAPFGAHRFCLNQRFRAFLYIAGTVFLSIISAEEGAPFVLLMILVGILDAVLFFVMPTSGFDQKYNDGQSQKIERKSTQKTTRRERQVQFKLMKFGVRSFESNDFEKAIHLFDKVLQSDQKNAVVHYYLACSFSMLRDLDDAFFHLGQAIEGGFEDFSRIERDRTLKNIRRDERYANFQETFMGYAPPLPPPKANLFDDNLDLSTLDKIEALGERLTRGELSTSEFEAEKTKILSPTPR